MVKNYFIITRRCSLVTSALLFNLKIEMFVYVFAGGQYLQEEFHPLPNDRIDLKYGVH